MAVTLLTTIPTVQPSYNPYYLVMSGSNSNLISFNYIVDIYSGTTYLRRLKVPPIPTSSMYGFCEISNITTDFITDNPIKLNFNTIGKNTEIQGNFNLVLGEEYKYTWNFFDNRYSSIVGYEGKIIFTGTTAHTYKVGDFIFVAQTAPFTNAGYEGVHRIIKIPDTKSVLVDYPFGAVTGLEPGITSYQDNRKIVFSGLSTSAITVGAYAIGHEDYITYQASANTLSSTNAALFLSDIPNNWKMRATNNGYINIFEASLGTIRIVVDGEGFSSPVHVTAYATTTGGNILKIPIAPKSINAAAGMALLTTNSSWYSVTIKTAAGVTVSEKKTFLLDSNCKPEDNIEFLFEDLKGNMVPINLRFMTSTSTVIQNELYKKPLNYTLSNGRYIYGINDSTEKKFAIKASKKYTAISEYLTESEATYFEQLLLSKNVYYNTKNTNYTSVATTNLSEYVPVVITNTSFQKKTTLRDGLIQYSVEFQLSNQRPLNI